MLNPSPHALTSEFASVVMLPALPIAMRIQATHSNLDWRAGYAALKHWRHHGIAPPLYGPGD